ncbi:amidohydrolase family protein [Actinoallomurus oryzae]|uniref:Amidohydrolase family protein n=1 Tax=Actinoallomurus oryzae TaxID=502180 RepID=A0ABP8QRP9_9ACTN
MTEYDLRLTGGDVVLPGLGRTAVDVCVRDGRVAALVERADPAPAREVLDVTGRVVVPGAIDAHVHLGQDITVPKTADDVAPETASAVAGGVTTMLAYLMSPKPYEESFTAAHDVMAADAYTDFGFHFCLVSQEQVAAIPRYVEEFGVSSFKFFMNFRGNEGAYLGLPGNDDGFLYDLLKAVAENGAMADPHAENIELVWKLRESMDKPADAGLDAWNRTRPDFVEAEALQRVAYLASVLGASVYAVHTTCAAALDAITRQRAHYPNLFVETCPHYLTLDETSSMGSRAKVNPPLRTAGDREALWAAVADGRVDVIGSDHVPRHFSAKDKDIWSASAGFPGTGTLFPSMVGEGHQRRGLPLERIVEATSTRPAQLFGMYPRKGVIAVGADADLVVLNLEEGFTVRAEDQHSAARYSVWEGLEVGCSVEHTLVRGRFAVRDGALGEAAGAYVSRPNSGAAALAAQGVSR